MPMRKALTVLASFLLAGCNTVGGHTAVAGRAVGRTGVLISVVSVSSVVLSPFIVVGLPIWLAGMPIYYSGCSIAGEKPEKNPFDL
jgi:predicted small secreted protein